MKSTLQKGLVALFLLTGQQIQAQNGKLHGQVNDKGNGEAIIGASVMLEGTKLGKVTDLDGRYVIQNIPAGTYTVTVSYISYSKQTFRNVVIADGKDVCLNCVLAEFADTLKTVEIKGKQGTHTTGSLLLFQQKNTGITVGISNDDIKRSPDNTTGQVLKRVSGATIQDNKFVIIRGLSDRYNTALINGMPLPTTEPDRKAFSFDIFPSAMLDNLLIFKTATPDLPGDFAGGVIQLNTRDIPEDNFLSFSSGTAFNPQSTFKEYLTYAGGRKDWLGIDDGTRQIPALVPDTKTYQNMLNDIFDPNPNKYDASKFFPNDWAIQKKSGCPPAQNYQLSFGSNLKFLKNDLGIIGALMYNNTRRTIAVYRADYNIDTARSYAFSDKQYKQNVVSGGMLNIAYKIGENNKLSFKSMISNTGEDLVVDRFGKDYEGDRYIRANTMQFTDTRLISMQLSGEHFIPKSDIKIKWGATSGNIWRNMPDVRRMYYNTAPGDSANGVYYAYVPQGAASPNYAGKYFSELNENLYSANADVTVPFKIHKQKQSFKVGGLYLTKERSYDGRVFGYVIANSILFNYNLLHSAQDTIFSEDHINQKGFVLKETTNNQDSYHAGSDLYAGFVQFDNRLFKKLRLVWGVRYESFEQKLNMITYGGDTIHLDTTYINVLPSLNLTWELNEKNNIRFAASKTTARPEFRELSALSFYDFNTYSAVYGNPGLKCSDITNLDLRYEIFPGLNQLFSFSLFYKDFKNPIEQIVDASSGAGSRTFTYQNAKRAVNYGAEIEARFKLSRIDSLVRWKQWENFTWFTNLSYIHSEVDLSNVSSAVTDDERHRALQGQSPYIINTGLQYVPVRGKLGFSILYNRIGRRITQVGSNGYLNIYEAPRNLLDVQVSYKCGKYFECRINLSDLLNNEQVFYQDVNGSKKYEKEADKKITGIKYGQVYSFTLSFKM